MDVTFLTLAVFLEGMASFLTPCVLPMIPAYMTYLTGQSLEVMAQDARARRVLMVNGLAFVVGFTIIFVLMGAVATRIGFYLLRHQHTLRRISGVLIVLFGLVHMGALSIPFLNMERRLRVQPKTPGLFPALLMGMGFSIGWTPCIGPILTSVLILAANAATVDQGMLLLGVYALGLGLPFLALTFGLKYLIGYLKGIYKYMRIIKMVSGIILVMIGVMIYFNVFYVLAYL